MFCEKCGCKTDDDQPFCPNCGNRLEEIPVSTFARDPDVSLSVGDVLERIGAMEGTIKIYYLCTGGLSVLCFLISLLGLFSANIAGISITASLASGGPLLANIITVLYTLSITFFVLDLFGKFSFEFLWHFVAAAAILILVLFVIAWIRSGMSLSGIGWIYFLLQIGLSGVSVLNFLE